MTASARRRLVLVTLAVVALVTLSGCSAIFGGIDDETLDREADYDELRASEADVAIGVEGGEFRAVYDLNETDSLSLYRSSLLSEEPLEIEAVYYWYPNNETVVRGSELAIDQGRTSTDVSVPDGNGTLAFSGTAGAKSLRLPAFVSGSYEVTLAEGHRTDNLLFGDVSPGGYERESVDGRERLTWEDLDGALSIRYFHERDLPLFVGFVAFVLVVGGLVVGYYYRQVKALEARRKQLGGTPSAEDDDGEPPGPG